MPRLGRAGPVFRHDPESVMYRYGSYPFCGVCCPCLLIYFSTSKQHNMAGYVNMSNNVHRLPSIECFYKNLSEMLNGTSLQRREGNALSIGNTVLSMVESPKPGAGVKCEVQGASLRGGKMRGTVRGINARRWVICEDGMCEAQ